jgi:hypothetical protein
LLSHWIRKREDKVVAKGKGELLTYWVEMNSIGSRSISKRSIKSATGVSLRNVMKGDHNSSADTLDHCNQSIKLFAERTERLIDWNSDILCRFLQQVIMNRAGTTSLKSEMDCDDADWNEGFEKTSTQNPFNEVTFVQDQNTSISKSSQHPSPEKCQQAAS